jgi:hypothetical protein
VYGGLAICMLGRADGCVLSESSLIVGQRFRIRRDVYDYDE